MPAISEDESRKFEEKASRGQEILGLLKNLGTKKNPNESDNQEIERLRQELNEINNWFQKSANF